MDDALFERLVRRVQMMFGRARISYVDDSGPVQKVQVRVSALETSDNRLRLAEFGFSSNPPIDSDALFLGISGDRSAVAAIATNHQPSRPRGLQSGETMLYSQDGKSVYMTAAGGIVVEAKGQDVVVNNARNVVWNCTGDFTHNVGGKYKVVAGGGVEFDTSLVAATGDVQDQSGSNEATMKSMREDYDEHGHPVVNVQAGGSTIISGTPTVPE